MRVCLLPWGKNRPPIQQTPKVSTPLRRKWASQCWGNGRHSSLPLAELALPGLQRRTCFPLKTNQDCSEKSMRPQGVCVCVCFLSWQLQQHESGLCKEGAQDSSSSSSSCFDIPPSSENSWVSHSQGPSSKSMQTPSLLSLQRTPILQGHQEVDPLVCVWWGGGVARDLILLQYLCSLTVTLVMVPGGIKRSIKTTPSKQNWPWTSSPRRPLPKWASLPRHTQSRGGVGAELSAHQLPRGRSPSGPKGLVAF